MRTLSLAVIATAVAAGVALPARAQEGPAEPVGRPGEQERPQTPKTQPTDLGFGQHDLAESYHFPDASDYQARVDRRDELDATADRTILWPTAHTPRQHRLTYSNYMLLLNRLSYSPTDDLQLTATVSFADLIADFHAGFAGKITLGESHNHVLSVQPFGMFHNETTELANRDLGVGTAVLVDLMASNDLIFTLAGAGYVTAWFGTEEFAYEDCQSRQDFLDGTCRNETTESTFFGSGGHFLAANAGLTWYMTNNFSMRGEVMSSLAAGSVLGTEWIREDGTPAEDRARFTEGEFAVGIPHGSIVTAGAGLAWSASLFSKASFAAQFSGYVTRAPSQFQDFEGNRDDVWVLVPMLNVSGALF